MRPETTLPFFVMNEWLCGAGDDVLSDFFLSELEEVNRNEENKLREEQRRHEATKQELEKGTPITRSTCHSSTLNLSFITPLSERKKTQDQSGEILRLAEELTKMGQMKARDEIISKQYQDAAGAAKEALRKLQAERATETEQFNAKMSATLVFLAVIQKI